MMNSCVVISLILLFRGTAQHSWEVLNCQVCTLPSLQKVSPLLSNKSHKFFPPVGPSSVLGPSGRTGAAWSPAPAPPSPTHHHLRIPAANLLFSSWWRKLTLPTPSASLSAEHRNRLQEWCMYYLGWKFTAGVTDAPGGVGQIGKSRWFRSDRENIKVLCPQLKNVLPKVKEGSRKHCTEVLPH